MTTKLFIIPGFKHSQLQRSLDDPNFVVTARAARACGYVPVPVNLSWRYKTMTQFVDDFVKFYEQTKGPKNIILGNSFGAMAAIIAEQYTKPDLMILCSLSAYFAEDVAEDPARISNRVGKRRKEDLKNFSANVIACRITTKTIFTYGEHEKAVYPWLYNRVKATQKLTEGSKLVEIPDALHRLRDYEYAAGVEKVLVEEMLA